MFKKLREQIWFWRVLRKSLSLAELAKVDAFLVREEVDEKIKKIHMRIPQIFFEGIGNALKNKYGDRLNLDPINLFGMVRIFGANSPAQYREIFNAKINLGAVNYACAYVLCQMQKINDSDLTEPGTDMLKRLLFTICDVVALDPVEKVLCWGMVCMKANEFREIIGPSLS